MGNLPIGQGELVTPDADGDRLRGDRQRRHPAPAAHRQRGRRQGAAAARRAPHHLDAPPRPRCATCSRACSRAGGTASEVSIPGYAARRQDRHRQRRSTRATGEYSKTAYVASFVGFAPAADPKLLCAVVVDEPQTGSIFGGTVAAPAFGQIMSFALPYLGIPPG